MSRKTMNVTAIIGTMTMSRKNSRNRVRKLDRRSRRSPMKPRSDMFRAGAYPRARSGPQGVHRAAMATIADPPGAIAQLGERLDRTQEVGGSSPPSSTPRKAPVLPGLSSLLGTLFFAWVDRGSNSVGDVAVGWERVESGPLGAERTVLLLPGGMCSARSYAE